ncbi:MULTISPECIES: hypothetical protein [Klebsiella]|uniref:hypothetical protein n=1 Tax=Klebsiella TaxID=570 RepID=UPI0027FED998|nr:hypothetical protein [Klebsiella aerogenes]MEA8825362.1 hypothetical protein [Klebsiella aerogenes]HBR6977497.1 hypothetical protein [Klebsiella aerogenes]HBT3178008.1 hypothetical protein [Klebsiella aerogenes]HDT4366830.1 hypothetical protein [Klebsiella aerogenes]HEO9722891.1 hypothetical protein [Klebsiella aerogenes]
MNQSNLSHPKVISLIRKDSDKESNDGDSTGDIANLMLERGMSLSEPVLDLLLRPILHCQCIVDSNTTVNLEYSFPTSLSFREVIDMGMEKKGEPGDVNLYNIIKLISKGISKKNKLPVIFERMKETITGSSQENHKKVSRCVIINDDFVKINKKNLISHYNYTESDASAFMKNLHFLTVQGVKVSELFLLKAEKISATKWFMLGVLFSKKGVRVDHWINLNVMENNLQYDSENNLTPEEHAKKNMAEIHFVSSDLTFWKSVTQWWINNNNEKLGNLTKLDKKTKDRLTVNTIRHNAVNYVISWLYVEGSDIHDAMFCLINRKIANQFPTLRNEAIRQIEARDYDF